ncbi:MAG: tetratricopeptide repeat protein [Acidimicrobiia bacterium]|jgi:hypothetical protein
MGLPEDLAHARGLLRAGRTEEAVAALERVVAAHPRSAEARGAAALALWDAGRMTESDAAALAALALDPTVASAHCARGLVAQSDHRPAEAVEHFDRALARRPDFVVALAHAAACHATLGDDERALALDEAVLRIVPGHPHARFGRALVLLRLGRYPEGWLDYEWRFLTGAVPRLSLPRPRWDGSNLAGRRILVHAEQGIGDTLQLVRFLPLLQEQGATVIVACSPRLVPLLERTPGIDGWFPVDEPAPADFDVFIPMGSLPGLLRIDEHTLARAVPYVFPEPDRVARWAAPVAAIGGFKVGICWQGSPTFVGDAFRSVPLRHFAPLGRVDGVHLVSLQKRDGEDDLASQPEVGPVTVLDGLDADGQTMVDTAAVMQHLDLVITSDTAIAHLAGALGIPVWVALSTGPDWRWLRGRTDSPWYPSLRCFRQRTLGDWDGVFAEMSDALSAVVAGDAPAVPPAPGPTGPTGPTVEVPVGAGELFDKLSILGIKAARVTDPAKLATVRRELAALEAVRIATYAQNADLRSLVAALDDVNTRLWDAENAVRACERRGELGSDFVELARSIHVANDERAELKHRINALLGSAIVEVKDYATD